MNLKNLSYSNALYAYRYIAKKERTVDEIAEEIETTRLGANKVLDKLLENKFIIKKSKKEGQMGRPKVYYSINPSYYCTIITPVQEYYIIQNIATNGDTLGVNKFEKEFQGFSPYNALCILRGLIGRENPQSLGTYILLNDFNDAPDVKDIQKISIEDLIFDSFADNDKAILIEFSGRRALINHGKFKYIDNSITPEYLQTIIELDEYYKLNDISNEEIAQRITGYFAIKQLEKRISQIFGWFFYFKRYQMTIDLFLTYRQIRGSFQVDPLQPL